MWYRLPVELQQQCIEYLDVETWKSLRLVSKSLSVLAAEALFEIVHVYHPEQSNDVSGSDEEGEEDKETAIAESVGQCNNIQEDDSLRPLVRTVIFHTSECEYSHESSYDQPESCLSEHYRKTLRNVSRFSNLREVQLAFSRPCTIEDPPSWWAEGVAETISFRRAVLHALFDGLDNAEYPAEHFDTLTLRNLQDHVSEAVYESPEFAAVLGKLRGLHLCITTEKDENAPESNIYMAGCQDMFNTDLCTRWLRPVQAHLTHLSIYTTQLFWGFWPYCDLHGVHFPQLKSLSLGNWTIVHDWQVEWVLSHGTTLEELLLDDCPIVTVTHMKEEQVAKHFPGLAPLRERMYIKELDLRWHAVFSRFRTALPRLRRFAFGSGDWGWQKMFDERYELASELGHDRYCMFDSSIGPSQWISGDDEWVVYAVGKDTERMRGHEYGTGEERASYYFPTCDEEDEQALGDLLEVVERRAMAKR